MAELIPAPFRDLVARLHREPAAQNALFELPRRHWYLPSQDQTNLSVRFHGRTAGNPCGPAAGPHTQMAQNLLLSYVAGGRILELKTVQVDDRLAIGRPCIDMTNVGYNIEWSQELRVEDSLREYVCGAMLIEMFRRSRELTGGALDGWAGDVIYDISVGYDLKGIKSEKVCGFLDGMRDASSLGERFRDEIPGEYSQARDLEFPTRLSDSITLSTFHGCPADEIEAICEFLIGEKGFDVIVKMNPPTLGKERLEHLLFDVLGYTDLRVNPEAYASVVSFDDSVELCRRLTDFAARRKRQLGFKFSNTLEVLNHREFFPAKDQIMYLSGQPLHVLTMALTDEFRRAVGPDVPISFSAGIDKHNFPLAVACGFVPVTISSDLLRPGGYGRLPAYLGGLSREMRGLGASTVDEYIQRFGERHQSVGGAERVLGALPEEPVAGAQGSYCDAVGVRAAGLSNTSIVAELARQDARYRADANSGIPKRIESHLTIFDCINCDKCLPVCPNAANFIYPTPKVAFDYHDLIVSPDGACREAPEARRFEITEDLQIACYADFCNECGNCDTFCPEYGGPYIEKPSFFGGMESFERAAPHDGFVIEETASGGWIRGRMRGANYRLTHDRVSAVYEFDDGIIVAAFSAGDHRMLRVHSSNANDAHHIDMWAYHTLRHLYHGVLDKSRINQVNAAYAE